MKIITIDHHRQTGWKRCAAIAMATLMIVSRQRVVAWMPSSAILVSKSDLILRRTSSSTRAAAAAISRWGGTGLSGSRGGYAATRASSSSTTTARFYSSSTEDRSAMSQSRAPFKMPKNSPDDSKPKSTEDTISWTDLGIWPDVSHYLQNELKLQSPTTVQSMVIPKLLQQQQQQYISGKADDADDPQQQHLAFLAATGSGKTIAYVLPLLQQLKRQEQEVSNPEEMLRRPQRPRVVILAPTRELVQQITTVVKSLSHCLKVSSHALMGGSSSTTTASSSGNKSLSRQTKTLQQRPMDVIVATPGRLLQHWKQKNSIFLGNVQTIVLDEMDTMLEQGFQKDLEQILTPLMMQGGSRMQGGSSSNNEKSTTSTTRPKDGEDDWDSDSATRKASSVNSSAASAKSTPPRIILTSATMTQSIQKLLGDSPKTSNLQLGAKRSYLNQKQKEEQQEQLLQDGTKKKAKVSTPVFQFPHMTIVTAPGLHKAVPRLKQTFVDVGSTDKMSLLIDVLSSNARGTRNDGAATIIFCNKVASVRAVQYALSEARIESLAYHAELNSAARTENLQLFRHAMEGRSGTSSSSKSSNTKKKAIDEDEWEDFEDMDIDTLPPTTTTKEPINILVCTDLAARGLDMPNIDHVVMFDFPLNSLDYLHRCGRTARGKDGTGAVTALVSKRDKVLALAIERAVRRGEPLDGLSSRKSDYTPSTTTSTTTGGGGGGGGSSGRGSGSDSSRTTANYKKRISSGGPTAGGRTSNSNGNSKPQRGRAAASPSRSGGGGGSTTSRSGSPGRRSR
jgi:superfamily II DNA/RNA helicase